MSDPTSSVTLDRGALDELKSMTGDDPAFFDEMIDTFLSDGPGLIAGMKAAAGSGDAAGLRLAAHTLKSNCRTFGATTLADLCQEIEHRAATGEMNSMDATVARAIEHYPAVAAALEAERSVS